MWRSLIRTPNDPVQAILRLALGLVIFPHAMQKLAGWFGGGGLAGTYAFMTGSVGVPGWLAVLAIGAEIVGTFLLIVGLAGRLGALCIAAVMLGAVATVHLPNGFFMNWSGQQAGEGYEYHLLALALCVAVVARGSGAWSLDRALSPDEPGPYSSRPVTEVDGWGV